MSAFWVMGLTAGVTSGLHARFWPRAIIHEQEPGRRPDQRMRRMPPNTSIGAPGLKNRLSTPGPLVTPGGIPVALMPVGSLRMPQVAYLRSKRLLTVAK